MNSIVQNTLYLLTPGLYVHRDHQSLRIEEHKILKLSVPIHNIESIVIFGPTLISPSAMQLCWENHVGVSFLSDGGRFLARVEGSPQGSVLLRRNQHQFADQPNKALSLVRHFLAGKIQNSRWCLLRSSRETDDADEKSTLKTTAQRIAHLLTSLERVETIEAARGLEGQTAALYFETFPLHLKPRRRQQFPFTTRTKRPARDALNCALSFLYALLRHDCMAALNAIGLDPYVGYLHADRPGRESLALDLMEEFRSSIDRLVISSINREAIQPKHFNIREGGVCELTESGRKKLVQIYHEKKRDETRHTLLQQKCRIGQLWFFQARILARVLRGDIPEYTPHLFR